MEVSKERGLIRSARASSLPRPCFVVPAILWNKNSRACDPVEGRADTEKLRTTSRCKEEGERHTCGRKSSKLRNETANV